MSVVHCYMSVSHRYRSCQPPCVPVIHRLTCRFCAERHVNILATTGPMSLYLSHDVLLISKPIAPHPHPYAHTAAPGPTSIYMSVILRPTCEPMCLHPRQPHVGFTLTILFSCRNLAPHGPDPRSKRSRTLLPVDSSQTHAVRKEQDPSPCG